jgi:hypothetical protein
LAVRGNLEVGLLRIPEEVFHGDQALPLRRTGGFPATGHQGQERQHCKIRPPMVEHGNSPSGLTVPRKTQMPIITQRFPFHIYSDDGSQRLESLTD